MHNYVLHSRMFAVRSPAAAESEWHTVCIKEAVKSADNKMLSHTL